MESESRSTSRYAKLASRLLVPPDPGARRLEPGDGARGVETLAVALRARSRRRSRRRWLTGAALASVISLITIGVLTFNQPSPITARLDGGAPLVAGSEVQAAAGVPVTVRLSTGTRLGLDGGRLDLQELGPRQRFALRAGRLRATVASLPAGQRFLVDTPDSQVEVRGTAFEVAVVPARSECDGAGTEVHVFEGLVTVRRNGRSWQVGPGQRWPADCAPAPAPRPPAPPPAPVPPVSAPAPLTDRRASSAPRRRAAAAPTPAPASTLAEQNDLFGAAVQARRRGDLAEARRRLDALLNRFPSGPLAESARNERDRLLREPAISASDRP